MNVAQDITIILVRSKDLLDHRSLSSRDQKNLDDTAFPHLHIGTEEDEGAAIHMGQFLQGGEKGQNITIFLCFLALL